MRARRVGHGGAAAGRREQHLGGEFGSGDRHGWRAEELTWGEPTDERTFYKRKCCSQREEYVLKKKEEEDMSILLLRMYNLESQPEGKGVG